MINVERTFSVNRPPDVVVNYLKDFANAEQWDPGTKSCTQVTAGPVVVGTTWHNVSVVKGKETELSYRLATLDGGHIVFVGENKTATSTDDITVTPSDMVPRSPITPRSSSTAWRSWRPRSCSRSSRAWVTRPPPRSPSRSRRSESALRCTPERRSGGRSSRPPERWRRCAGSRWRRRPGRAPPVRRRTRASARALLDGGDEVVQFGTVGRCLYRSGRSLVRRGGFGPLRARSTARWSAADSPPLSIPPAPNASIRWSYPKLPRRLLVIWASAPSAAEHHHRAVDVAGIGNVVRDQVRPDACTSTTSPAGNGPCRSRGWSCRGTDPRSGQVPGGRRLRVPADDDQLFEPADVAARHPIPDVP